MIVTFAKEKVGTCFLDYRIFFYLYPFTCIDYSGFNRQFIFMSHSPIT